MPGPYGISGNNRLNATHVKTPKGQFQSVGNRTKETGLPLSGNLAYEPIYVVVNAPAFTMNGNVLSFSSFVDLSAVRYGDTFADNTAPIPSTFTVQSVDFEVSTSTFNVTLDAAPTTLTAGGAFYRSAVANGIGVWGMSIPGGSGIDVNLRDEIGQAFDFDNPLPVQLSGDGIEVQVDVAHLNVQLDHVDRTVVRYKGGWQSDAAPSTNISGGAATRDFQINVNSDGLQTVTLTNCANLNTGPKIAAAIQDLIRSSTAITEANQDAYDHFEMEYTSGSVYRAYSGDWGPSSSVVFADSGADTLISAGILMSGGASAAITIPETTTITGDSTRIGDGTDIVNVVIEDEDISSFDGGILQYGESVTQTAKKFQCVEDADSLGAGEDKGNITYFKSAQLVYSATLAFVDSDPDTITDGTSGFIAAGFHEGMSITVSGTVSNNGTFTIATVAAGTLTLIAGDTLTAEGAVACTITVDPEMADTFNVAHQGEAIGNYGRGLVVYGRDNSNNAKAFEIVQEDDDISAAGNDGGLLMYGESNSQTAKMFQVLEDDDVMAAGEDKGGITYFKDAGATPEVASTFNVAFQGDAVGTNGRGLMIYGRDVADNAKALEIVEDGGVTSTAGDDGGILMYAKSAGAAPEIADTFNIAFQGDALGTNGRGLVIYGRDNSDNAKAFEIVQEDDDISGAGNDGGLLLYGESVSQTAKMLQIVEESDVLAAGEDKGIILYGKSAGATPDVANPLNIAMQGDALGTNAQGVVVYGRDVSNNAKTIELVLEGGDLDAEAGDDAGFMTYFKSAGATTAARDIAATLHIATEDVDISTYDNGIVIYGEAVDQTAKKLQIVEETDVMAAGEDKGILFYAKSAGATPDVANTLNIATQGDALGTNDHGIVTYGRKIDDSATVPLFVEAGDDISGAGDDAGVVMYGEAVDQTAKIPQIVEQSDVMAAGEDKGFLVYGKTAGAAPDVAEAIHVTTEDADISTYDQGFTMYGESITGTAKKPQIIEFGEASAAGTDKGLLTYFQSAGGTPLIADTPNVAMEAEAIGTNGRGFVVYGRDPSDDAKTLEFNAAGELTTSSTNGYATETVTPTMGGGDDTDAFATSLLPYAKVSVQVVWSGVTTGGAFDGFVYMQVSNDNANWENLPIGGVAIDQAAGSEIVFSQDIPYRYGRIFYDENALTGGTLNCYIVLKAS